MEYGFCMPLVYHNLPRSSRPTSFPVSKPRATKLWYTICVTDESIERAKADIEATGDLLERTLKLSGLVTALFQEQDFPLVVVGGCAVEFYTEGGYMSGDVDFCRRSLKAIPLRLMADVMSRLGGKSLGRNWLVCGIYVDFLGLLESETVLPNRELETPYGKVYFLPPELALVERIIFAESSAECLPSARQMMAAALQDGRFDWAEARRLADLPDFKVLPRFEAMRKELSDGSGA